MLKENFVKLTNMIDRKLENGTIMVVIIGTLITLSGFFTSTVNANLMANVMQSQKNTEINQYIIIDGKKFQIILKEIK